MNGGARGLDAAKKYAPVRPSRALLRFFDTYLRIFFKRHFHGLRLAGAGHWTRAQGPRLVCLNHPSWWDPLFAIALSRYLQPELDHYAPMDEAAFARYGIFRKLGLFPVEQGTARGAAQFLRAAQHILGDPRAVLWVTPQGGFADVRVRPLAFRPGLDGLLRRAERVTVVPLAIEYTFWDERLPEALALLGEPLEFARGRLIGTPAISAGTGQPPYPRSSTHIAHLAGSPGDATDKGILSAGEQVAAALARTGDALALLAARRDPLLFAPVLAGAAGTGGIYGGWQRMRAWTRGERFHPEHASLHARAGSPHA